MKSLDIKYIFIYNFLHKFTSVFNISYYID